MLDEKAFKTKSSHFMKAFKAQNINYSKKANKTQSIQVLEGLSEFRFPGYIIK